MITAQRVGKAAIKHLTRAMIGLRGALGAKRAYLCPGCGAQVVNFFRYGDCGQWGCPECGASPRERLVNYLLERGGLAVPQGGAILHVAPGEASLVRRFSALGGRYVPADLDPSRYHVPGVQPVDLMALAPAQKYDLIYASHVMEHVPDDAKVLRNMFDALNPGGEAWLLVPLWNQPSEDGAPGMSGKEREQRFGQWDHVRQYGLDFADRIRAAGFEVELIRAADMPAADRQSMALGDILFRARKPAAAS